ncbi:hypothetical protein BC830DRAFT_1102468 [Chytriomyces sp. MP71]|nr:hypothetical protein BC830DRAFT_1102468 [Chytriomyces sp. MP71]
MPVITELDSSLPSKAQDSPANNTLADSFLFSGINLADIPTEIIVHTLAWIHPKQVLVYRRLCKAIDRTLTSKHFALTNLRRFMPTGATPPTVSTHADEFDRLWFAWPHNYQMAYIDLKLGRLVEIGWCQIQLQVACLSKLFGELCLLTRLDLRFCSLQGGIPMEFGQMRDLTVLKLTSNNLSGILPADLGCLSNLQVLDLSFNRFTGILPRELGNLQNLQLLDISNNRLFGSIPVEYGNLFRLQCLNLSSNKLSGCVPTELSHLVGLYRLYLGSNKLSGRIPAEFANLVNLEVLILTGNRISLLIPPRLLPRNSRVWSLILENGLPLMTFIIMGILVGLLSLWHLRALHLVFFGKVAFV